MITDETDTRHPHANIFLKRQQCLALHTFYFLMIACFCKYDNVSNYHFRLHERVYIIRLTAYLPIVVTWTKTYSGSNQQCYWTRFSDSQCKIYVGRMHFILCGQINARCFDVVNGLAFVNKYSKYIGVNICISYHIILPTSSTQPKTLQFYILVLINTRFPPTSKNQLSMVTRNFHYLSVSGSCKGNCKINITT